MKKFFLALLIAMVPVAGFAAGPTGPLMDPRVDPNDKASLQRGAKYFVNYCLGCHSAQYQRYNRLAADLDLPEDLVEQYLILTDAQIGDTMETAMDPVDAERWFGVAPPDLTLTTRLRGADWVYTYLNSFYVDPSKASGWNNTLFPDVAMPHVLWTLQGTPEPAYEEHNGEIAIAGIQVEEGSGLLNQAEYQAVTRDITNFMAYIAEPIKADRQSLGIKVIAFLLVFTILAYLLKKEYWKDVH